MTSSPVWSFPDLPGRENTRDSLSKDFPQCRPALRAFQCIRDLRNRLIAAIHRPGIVDTAKTPAYAVVFGNQFQQKFGTGFIGQHDSPLYRQTGSPIPGCVVDVEENVPALEKGIHDSRFGSDGPHALGITQISPRGGNSGFDKKRVRGSAGKADYGENSSPEDGSQ